MLRELEWPKSFVSKSLNLNFAPIWHICLNALRGKETEGTNGSVMLISVQKIYTAWITCINYPSNSSFFYSTVVFHHRKMKNKIMVNLVHLHFATSSKKTFSKTKARNLVVLLGLSSLYSLPPYRRFHRGFQKRRPINRMCEDSWIHPECFHWNSGCLSLAPNGPKYMISGFQLF